MTSAVVYLAAVLALRRFGARLLPLAMLPLLVLDCWGNMLLAFGAAIRSNSWDVFDGSWGHTLSATSWSVRAHTLFGWTHVAIDVVFGNGHCEQQAAREEKWGSVWAAWWADVRGVL